MKRIPVIAALLVLLLLAFWLSLASGAVKIPLAVLWEASDARAKALQHILWFIRVPRAVASALVGGSLALAGAAMQGLFRNPLVDPGIVGIMSGAALSVSLTVVLMPAGGFAFVPAMYVLPLSAFLGGWCSTLLLYHFAKQNGQLQITVLLLLGIALAAFTGAITGVLTYLADDQQIRSLTFWSMGSLASFNWQMVAMLSAVMLLTVPLLLREARALNAIMLGEQVAGHLGFNVNRSKTRLIILVALLTGVCVAFSGGIAFVGLVVPHIMRSIVGADHRILLPTSALCGALLLTLADVSARLVVAPAELPIGIVTAMIGAPFLGYLVWQKAKFSSF